MNVASTRLDLCRSLYWANQGLLNAVHALQEAEKPTSSMAARVLNHDLQRTQAIIEESRMMMNKILTQWIERKE